MYQVFSMIQVGSSSSSIPYMKKTGSLSLLIYFGIILYIVLFTSIITYICSRWLEKVIDMLPNDGFSWWFTHGRIPKKNHQLKTNPKIIIPKCSMYGIFYLHVP